MIWLNLENRPIHRFLKLVYDDSETEKHNTILEDDNVLTNRKITIIVQFLCLFAGKLTVTVSELSENKEDENAVARYQKLVDNILKPLR